MQKFVQRFLGIGNRFLSFIVFPITLLLKWLGVRVLDVNYQAIGHLALEPDLYLKEQKLNGTKHFTILFVPHAIYEGAPFKIKVSNSFLLKCWEEHFYVIHNFFLYLALSPLFKSSTLKYKTQHYQATKLLPFYIREKEAAYIYNRYHTTYGTTCHSSISLKLKDLERGKIILERLGIPNGAWYVCFNCREAGHYSAKDSQRTRCRNATIANLEAALKEVISRGGYCIRLGSSFSAPLPLSLKQYREVIDYPHTEEASQFMDIYLASTCKFFIGNNSGLTHAAGVLGTPCVLTNIVPFGVRSFFARDIGIFKLQKSKITGKLLSFSHCLHSYLCSSIHADDYEEFQIELIENSSEEIRDVVIEMFDQLDDQLLSSSEDELLQKKFLSLLTPFNLNYQSPSKIGKRFLKKYESLLS